jgi:hypothetical protein
LKSKIAPIHHAGCPQIIARHYRENRYILRINKPSYRIWEVAAASADGSTFEHQLHAVFGDIGGPLGDLFPD